jgi:hypothetical protein
MQNKENRQLSLTICQPSLNVVKMADGIVAVLQFLLQ